MTPNHRQVPSFTKDERLKTESNSTRGESAMKYGVVFPHPFHEPMVFFAHGRDPVLPGGAELVLRNRHDS